MIFSTKKMDLYNKIKRQYTTILLSVFASIIIFSFFLLNSLSNKLIDATFSPVSELISELAIVPIISRNNEDMDDLKKFINAFPFISNYAIISAENEIIIDNFPDSISANSILMSSNKSSNDTSSDQWSIKTPVYLSSTPSEFFPTNSSMSRNDTIIGYVYLVFNNNPGKNFLVEFITYFVFFMLISYLIGSYSIGRLTKRNIKPISNMKSIMKSYRVDGIIKNQKDIGIREYDELFRDLNLLLTTIENQKKDIDSTNRELEQRVASKTESLQVLIKNLEAQDELKTQFIANVSHEIRTPIQSIIGYAKIIKNELENDSNPKYADDFRKILNNADNLIDLITRLLDFSKIQSGTVSIELQNETPDTIHDNLVSSLEMLAQKNKLEIQIDKETIPSVVKIDMHSIRQILSNLVSNSEKFTKNGLITVSVKHEYSWLIFEVSDTGIGINPDQSESIFQAFKQADGTSRRKYGGTGIGLTISRKLAEIMGGDLVLNKEYIGGASFRLRVPCSTLQPR